MGTVRISDEECRLLAWLKKHDGYDFKSAVRAFGDEWTADGVERVYKALNRRKLAFRERNGCLYSFQADPKDCPLIEQGFPEKNKLHHWMVEYGEGRNLVTPPKPIERGDPGWQDVPRLRRVPHRIFAPRPSQPLKDVLEGVLEVERANSESLIRSRRAKDVWERRKAAAQQSAQA